MTKLETEINRIPVGGKFAYMVWYVCPISQIRQTYASFDTIREARACATEIRVNGII